jgi:hypothetical protein
MTTSNATPTPSTPEHDTAMAAAFDARQSEVQAATAAPAASSETAPAERPAWLPEGFNSPEDFAAAYTALKAGQQAPASETPAPENATPEDAQKAAEAAGVDYDAVQNEWMEKGALSAETYASLEKAGIPKTMVDGYIAGQQAVADRIQTEIYGTVGGVEGYTQMTAWAANNLTPAEITAFDNAVSSDSVETIKMAVLGLKARYADANGSEPNLLGGQGGNSQTDVFRSTSELTAAMSDPRYAKDRAYRADVEAKIARSSVF